jgi:hypothetical protein
VEITEQDEIEMGFCQTCSRYKPACICTQIDGRVDKIIMDKKGKIVKIDYGIDPR